MKAYRHHSFARLLRFELLEDRQLLSVGNPVGGSIDRADVAEPADAFIGLDWAAHAGSADIGAYANRVATDASGNVYVAGTFYGPYSSPFHIPTSTFVAKYSSGGELLWSRDLAEWDDGTAEGIAVGADGSVYVTGSIGILSSSCYNSIYFSKLDTDGNSVWTRRLSGEGKGFGSAITVGDDGSIYATGRFEGALGYYVGSDYVVAAACTGWADVFIAKLDSDGNFNWVKSMGGDQSCDWGKSIAVAEDGSVYIAGLYTGTTDFDPGPDRLILTCNGFSDIFVSKLDSDGNFIWAKGMGGIAHDTANDVAVAADGSVYLAGAFADTVDFDPGSEQYSLTSSHDGQAYVLKLDADGNFLWAEEFYAVEGGGSSGTGIALADDGSLYTTGTVWGANKVGPSAFDLTTDSGRSAYVSKLDADGNVVWAMTVSGYSSGADIAAGDAQTVFVVGAFNGIADFDPSTETFSLTSTGSGDLFVLELSPITPIMPDYLLNASSDPLVAYWALSRDISRPCSLYSTNNGDPSTAENGPRGSTLDSTDTRSKYLEAIGETANPSGSEMQFVSTPFGRIGESWETLLNDSDQAIIDENELLSLGIQISRGFGIHALAADAVFADMIGGRQE